MRMDALNKSDRNLIATKPLLTFSNILKYVQMYLVSKIYKTSVLTEIYICCYWYNTFFETFK